MKIGTTHDTFSQKLYTKKRQLFLEVLKVIIIFFHKRKTHLLTIFKIQFGSHLLI